MQSSQLMHQGLVSGAQCLQGDGGGRLSSLYPLRTTNVEAEVEGAAVSPQKSYFGRSAFSLILKRTIRQSLISIAGVISKEPVLHPPSLLITTRRDSRSFCFNQKFSNSSPGSGRHTTNRSSDTDLLSTQGVQEGAYPRTTLD